MAIAIIKKTFKNLEIRFNSIISISRPDKFLLKVINQLFYN